MNNNTKKLIHIENLYKNYLLGKKIEVKVLKDISLDINEGELIAIIGPSGSGKSTLMNIIGCLDIPSSGNYFFEGKDISTLDADELATLRSEKISFVFQSFNLLHGKTVFENVMLPLMYQKSFKGSMQERTAESLRMADLEESLWQNKPNQLSGGQQQRVAIARALVNRPKILLADEPTGNLDSQTGINVVNELKKLNREYGTTIIMITHDTSMTEKVDRVITIKDGLILE
mgnify:CR=1 FL=1